MTGEISARVQREVDDFLAAQATILADVHSDCAPLVGYLTGFMTGGKRLRAAFCYWAWRAAGGADGPEIVRASAALEFFQAAALIHDDVMDASETRRGAPAMHRRFAALHSGHGWRGEPDRFGESAAVLAGDLCLVWSDELYTASGLHPLALTRGRAVFNGMRTQLMGGQYLDLLEQAIAGGRERGALERARRVVHYKSAKYTVEHPLLLGARLAGAGDDLLGRLSGFGLPLGEAFQLRDDILGVFGDPARTGKPAGDDLREGKRTVLIALALDRARAPQKALVDELLGSPALDEPGVGALREIIVDTGALDAVEDMISGLLERSLAALTAAPMDRASRSALEGLARAATDRVA
ncbi:polyprenyl synthetase family protein [Actinoplanes sp. CA-131856]